MKIENEEMWEAIEYGNGDWEIVVDGDWIQDVKYQNRENVVLHKPTGKHYCYSYYRSGSPFSDWYYSTEDEYPELFEVVKKTRTIVEQYWGGV